MTIAATLKYAQEGFDGVIHMKSSGCTPEIDCMPVLQYISRDMHMPVLYLSYDSQTSDTGLDTRLEAFYDMLAMKKEKQRRLQHNPKPQSRSLTRSLPSTLVPSPQKASSSTASARLSHVRINEPKAAPSTLHDVLSQNSAGKSSKAKVLYEQ